jgi:maltose O-acetyltransferase
VIGAGSVVTHDIPDNVVAAGNPARVLMSLESFLARRREEVERFPRFEAEFAASQISDEMKQQMNKRITDRFGYIP